MDAFDEQNPIRRARERLGLSRLELAQLLDVSYERVAATELGHARQLPRHWRIALAKVGITNFAELAVQYNDWRQAKAVALYTGHEDQ
jgi:DNA-binding XRE family transcriptional regulator